MKKPIKSPFWDRVRALIRANKISQRKYAVYIGVPYGTLKDWMCYGVWPDILSAVKIAESLGVTMEYLVRGKDSISSETKEKETKKRKEAAEKIKKMLAIIEKNANIIG